MKRILSLLVLSALLLSSLFTSPALALQVTEELPLILKNDVPAKYIRSTKTISGINPGTSVDTLLSYIDSDLDKICVKTASGSVITSGVIGSGCKVEYRKPDSVEVADIVIYGDLNGDSKINSSDLLLMKRQILGLIKVEGAMYTAANVIRDSSVNSSDLLFQKRHVLNLSTIYNSSLYYVSKSGNNNNIGSIDSPFLTIQKAADIMTSGDTCYIMGGEYKEEVTVKNEGEDGADITFKNHDSSPVVVSGLETVKSPWSVYKDGIYKTSISLYRGYENQVFINGTMATLSRYPNKGTNQTLPVGNTLSADLASANYVNDAALTQPDGYFNGADIAIEGTNHYIYYSSTVTAYTAGRADFTMLDSGWDSPTVNSNYYFFNKLNLLDCENEWHYENGSLYLMPNSGLTPNDLKIEYKVRDNAFILNGKSYISLIGLNVVGANIKNDAGSDNMTIDKLNIKYYYHTSKARHYPWEADFYGIELNGAGSTIKNSEISYGAEGGIEIRADNCSVVNNYIHNIGYMNSNAGAITPKRCNYTLIAYNTIENIARSGILLTATNLRVCYNKIINAAVNMHDTSAIGSYKFDAMGLTEVDHNIVSDSQHNHMLTAYYIDNGSLNYLFHHNVAYNVDTTMFLNNPSYGNRIYNNTLIGGSAVSTGNFDNPYKNNEFIGSDWSGTQFYNNIMPAFFYGNKAMLSNNMYYKNANINFTDEAMYDFSLKSDSAAINKGLALPVGNENAVGAPDIGAYEYGTGKWEAGCDLAVEREIKYSLSEKKTGFTPIYGDAFLELSSVTGTNLIKNSSFENGLTGWQSIGAQSVMSQASEGNYAAKITSNGGWVNQYLDQNINAGQTYYISGKVKLFAPVNFAEFGVHFLNSNDQIIAQHAFYATDSRYTSMDTLFTVPVGATKIRIFIASWAKGQEIYIDNIKLIKIT